jgi:hypothetical protein
MMELGDWHYYGRDPLAKNVSANPLGGRAIGAISPAGLALWRWRWLV